MPLPVVLIIEYLISENRISILKMNFKFVMKILSFAAFFSGYLGVLTSFAVIIRNPEAVNSIKVPQMKVVSGHISHRNLGNQAYILRSHVNLFPI